MAHCVIVFDIHTFVRLLTDAQEAKEWPVGQAGVMDFTSTVSVVPNTFPYEDCSGVECIGSLL